MKLEIVDLLTSYNLTNASRDKDDIKYIVIHYFGSLGTAKSAANYFGSAYRGASAHYALDEGDTVYRCVKDEDIAWHCGTSGTYYHEECRNKNSIGIEVRPYKLDSSRASYASDTDWYFTQQIEDNLVELTKYLMELYDIDAGHVVRHYDVTHKLCPRPYVGDDTNDYYGESGNARWAKFKARLVESEDQLDMTKDELMTCADTGDTPADWAKEATEYCKRKGIFCGDGNGNYGWDVPIARQAVAQIIYNVLEAAGMLDALPDTQ